MAEANYCRVSVNKPENGMLRGLAVRIKLQEATNFSGSCGCAAKKRAPQAAPLGEVLI